MAVKEVLQTIKLVRLIHDPNNMYAVFGDGPPVRVLNYMFDTPSERDYEAEAVMPAGSICRRPGKITTFTMEMENGGTYKEVRSSGEEDQADLGSGQGTIHQKR